MWQYLQWGDVKEANGLGVQNNGDTAVPKSPSLQNDLVKNYGSGLLTHLLEENSADWMKKKVIGRI